MNSVSNIKRLIISNSLTYEKKMELKKLGPPKPNLDITQQNYKTDWPASSKKNYTRKFNRNCYLHADWICAVSYTHLDVYKRQTVMIVVIDIS